MEGDDKSRMGKEDVVTYLTAVVLAAKKLSVEEEKAEEADPLFNKLCGVEPRLKFKLKPFLLILAAGGMKGNKTLMISIMLPQF